MPSLPTRYKEKIKTEGYYSDPVQEQAVQALQSLLEELANQKSLWLFAGKPIPKGVYLHGGVGRGKSMIMDLFFNEIPKGIKKRRTHFHSFMIETHDWLHANRADRVDDLLPRYAAVLAKKVKVLCFDEFHVTDIADAMILGRLFTALFDKGVIVVATSNWHPDHLYEGGLQRQLFLPFIDLLKQKTHVLHLDNGMDYRQISCPGQDLYYFHPLNKETEQSLNKLFFEITDYEEPETDTLHVKGRALEITASGAIARFDFKELCQAALGAEDYIEIAQIYHTIFIENVRVLTQEMRNEAKRFILLIDCLYEAGCRVVISAEEDIDDLHESGDHAFEFQRTISRLMEMQSAEYHQKHKERIT
jgi:cell division protein ZapE